MVKNKNTKMMKPDEMPGMMSIKDMNKHMKKYRIEMENMPESKTSSGKKRK